MYDQLFIATGLFYIGLTAEFLPVVGQKDNDIKYL